MESSAPRYETPLVDTTPVSAIEPTQTLKKSEKSSTKPQESVEYWVFDNGICG